MDKKQRELLTRICGEIVLSEYPGETMRKWRELFKIGQSELSAYLNVSPSTVSDYEANRRKSPGTKVIKRFVNALLEIDSRKGGKEIERLVNEFDDESQKFFELIEFSKGIDAEFFVKKIKGRVISSENKLQERKVYGYTLIDSLNVILNVPYNMLHRIYGSTNERALIFTGVTTGRSPMVVVRTNPIKPSLVVFINLDKVDELALKISERENVPIITTRLNPIEIKEALADL